MTPSCPADTRALRLAPSDPHDRALVRHMLTLTPAERLRNVSAFWSVARVGLERRRALSDARRR